MHVVGRLLGREVGKTRIGANLRQECRDAGARARNRAVDAFLRNQDRALDGVRAGHAEQPLAQGARIVDGNEFIKG